MTLTMKNNTPNLNVLLTEHFTLREMVASGTAIRLKIDNTPREADIERLRALCQHVLEPLRRRFGVIRVTSGYRCPALNKAVKGAAHSQHLRGEAADLHCASEEQARRMMDYVKAYLPFDQLLLERRLANRCCWLHVSYVAEDGGKRNRHAARIIDLGRDDEKTTTNKTTERP